MQQAESIQKSATPERIFARKGLAFWGRTKVRAEDEKVPLNGTAEAVPLQSRSSESISVSGRAVRLQISTTRRRRDSGAMLLAILFMMAIMVIVAMAMAPSFIQQAKRDREEEMIHRGTEYARAVKKYYKKFGRYPANLEQLDNTNQIRFLRRRFKDPLTKEGDWKLLHYGDIQAIAGIGTGIQGVAGLQGQGGVQGANPLASLSSGANAAGATGSDQGANTAPQGAQLTPQQPGAGLGNQTPGNAQPGTGTSPSGTAGQGAGGQSGFSLAPGIGQSSGSGGGQQGQTATGQNATGQTGTNNSIFGNSGVGGQTFGGGAIVGVASKDKDKTIRIYNKKKTYDEWVFIYSPAMETGANTLLRGPFNGQSYGGAQIGTPAGQMNQGNQSPFGQQPGVQGQQPGGFGQQNPPQNSQPNQQLTPGGQFPPDQTQPQ
jgi:type II secretory pathway pseudopilin PulG